MAEEVHWARVRAAMAAVALRKGGRRWRPSAERAVVRAVRCCGCAGVVLRVCRRGCVKWRRCGCAGAALLRVPAMDCGIAPRRCTEQKKNSRVNSSRQRLKQQCEL